MTRFSFLAACVLGAALAVSAPARTEAQNGQFLSVVEDVPLMAGMVEDEATAVVFDAAQGRIAETTASGSSFSRHAVLTFYGETLPALGWRPDGEGRWLREGELLTIEFEDASGKGQLVVRFSLSPAKPR
ncbi:MAG: hypothetical protein FJX42_00930 [Alphaproteobacteria bacterium]|nr:hypothetical protein [Alphaproteobacteria bacterium]